MKLPSIYLFITLIFSLYLCNVNVTSAGSNEDLLLISLAKSTMTPSELEKLANAGDGDAQFILGSFNYYGKGVPVNNSSAMHWFEKASANGNSKAQLMLGVMYDNGSVEVPKNKANAIKFYKASAMQGNAKAQYNLASKYHDGDGVIKDNIQAFEWMQKAAMQGDAAAQFNLGMMYFNSEGTPKDFILATRWWGSSANQGFAMAQFNLAMMYASGEGVSKDDIKSMSLLKASASQGLVNAQVVFGNMYAEGSDGMPQDLKIASEWYKMAAEQGDAHAQLMLKKISEGGIVKKNTTLDQKNDPMQIRN